MIFLYTEGKKSNHFKRNPSEIPADFSAEYCFLRNFLRIYLRKNVSWEFSYGYFCGITRGLLAAKFSVDLILFSAENSFLRIQNSVGKPNPQEMCFLQIFCPNP
jgi:hypothetical protein